MRNIFADTVDEEPMPDTIDGALAIRERVFYLTLTDVMRNIGR